ncbi:MAG: serine protease [Planctomycetota bacterium]|nr:serine protease [Planctomycetota bacterium]
MLRYSRFKKAPVLEQASGLILGLSFLLVVSSSTWAQSVCLPLPRLLTLWPMGGTAGEIVTVRIQGEHVEDPEALLFSHPGITATPRLDDMGALVPGEFVVTVSADTPEGVYEARLLSRLGVSSARSFSVSSIPETVVVESNISKATAFPIAVNAICNAKSTLRAVDYFSLEAKGGQRLLIECAARGIDSKLKPVLIVADSTGRDLRVERGGDVLDFTVPEDGNYLIKTHDLTYQGGANHFYRLSVREVSADAKLTRMPAHRAVNSFSWPPEGLAETASQSEAEPNDQPEQVQRIELPCDLAGSFYPAADVDHFEFVGKKGETWWIEVASQRLGRPTDPNVLVQRVSVSEDGTETMMDLAELKDIASPIKPSGNQYAYDGPPYDAGSADVLGAVELPEDGRYRVQLRDLFGGTRTDPRNRYRLLIRKAQPDFAVVAWGMHMVLRNGDRAALSKPMALRNGATVPLEVVCIRRDGFDGPIDISMQDLPEGVTATGLRIPAGQTKGVLLVSAAEGAPRGWGKPSLQGVATINGVAITRPCPVASMVWPVKDHWQEIPHARLLGDVVVSVGGSEVAPITIGPAEGTVVEAKVGDTLKIPLKHVRRCDFSGAAIKLKTLGAGFTGVPTFEASLTSDESEAVVDLGKLKTLPGEYHLAFYGSAVAKYEYNPTAVILARSVKEQAELNHKLASEELEKLKLAASGDSSDSNKATIQAKQEALDLAKSRLDTASKTLEDVINKAKPADIVDIIVSEPITIRVNPAESP